MLPASMVWASEDGTSGNPYKISMAADFDLMRNNLSASFILENNIDLTGVSWTMIGQDDLSPFVGNFDGQGHSITGLSINSDVDFSGLFGAVGLEQMG